MKLYTFLSSEVYHLDPKDVNDLPDTQGVVPIKGMDGQVVILLGNGKKQIEDSLYQGRAVVLQSIENKTDYIPVRIAFHRVTPWFDCLTPFCKKVRKHFYTYGTHIYHMDALEIRKKGLERKIRTPENAYDFSKWHLPQEQRDKQFNELKNSLSEKGFDDSHPLEIMLCRTLGIQDTLQQGHHRMMFCLDMGIRRVAVRFMAVSHAPGWLAPILRGCRKLFKKEKKNG